jgi:hypothetical protein
MNLTITLPPELEEELQARASASGQEVAEYVVQTLEERLRGKPTVDEILAPFRRQVEESGMTDEKLETFWEEVRDEFQSSA